MFVSSVVFLFVFYKDPGKGGESTNSTYERFKYQVMHVSNIRAQFQHQISWIFMGSNTFCIFENQICPFFTFLVCEYQLVGLACVQPALSHIHTQILND